MRYLLIWLLALCECAVVLAAAACIPAVVLRGSPSYWDGLQIAPLGLLFGVIVGELVWPVGQRVSLSREAVVRLLLCNAWLVMGMFGGFLVGAAVGIASGTPQGPLLAWMLMPAGTLAGASAGVAVVLLRSSRA